MGISVRFLIGPNGQILNPGEPRSCRHKIRNAAARLVPEFCRTKSANANRAAESPGLACTSSLLLLGESHRRCGLRDRDRQRASVQFRL